MAISEYYVDPSLGSDTGNGTVDTPWGRASGSVVQYALNTISRNVTDGDRINIKSDQAVGVTTTTDDVLAAALDLSTYGIPTFSVPLVFEGYTSAVRDGGIGGISGDGSYSVIATLADGVHFKNMHLHNSGSAAILNLDDQCSVINCEINNTTGAGASLDSAGVVAGCYVHNTGGPCVKSDTGLVYGNYIDLADGTAEVAVLTEAAGGTVCFNTIRLTGSGNDSIGIVYRDAPFVFNNSVWSDAGTGKGIDSGGSSNYMVSIFNNVVEGFSGGGVGIEIASGDGRVLWGANQLYNNSTHISDSGEPWVSKVAADVAPTASAPMNDPANEDFEANNVIKDTAWPSSFQGSSTTQYLDAGAAQRKEPVGGGSVSPGGDASDYMEDQVADYVFRAGYGFQTDNVYLAFFTSDPGEDNSGSEVSGNGYVRQLISFGEPSIGTIINDAAIVFPVATGSWGIITHFAIFDSETDGNMLVYSEYYPSSSIDNDDQITVNSLQVIID